MGGADATFRIWWDISYRQLLRDFIINILIIRCSGFKSRGCRGSPADGPARPRPVCDKCLDWSVVEAPAGVESSCSWGICSSAPEAKWPEPQPTVLLHSSHIINLITCHKSPPKPHWNTDALTQSNNGLWTGRAAVMSSVPSLLEPHVFTP